MGKLSIRTRRNRVAALLLLVSLSFFYAFHLFSMWQKASTFSEDASVAMSVFAKASEFLSQNLKQNQMALVPMIEVFYVLSPQSRDRLIDYKSLWDSAGVILKADTTEEEALNVRNYFISFLKENPQVKYVIRDWVDPYAKLLYEATANDELSTLLSEVKVVDFTFNSGWGYQISVYENVQYAALFAMKLSSRPDWSVISPVDTPITWDSEGVTIQKGNQTVALYLPFERGINSSKHNYVTMLIRPNLENLYLIISFYYDKNGDGVYSAYDPDYIKQVGFNQTEMGWTKGQKNKIYFSIPQTPDPVGQIAIVALPRSTSGSITLSDLIVYSEIDVETVFADASTWLSDNLKENEKALVPSPGSFLVADPNLEGKLLSYQSLWVKTGIRLGANTTIEETLKVRSNLTDFLKENPQVKYVVRDWVDPYAEHIYGATTKDELTILLNEYKVITLTLGVGWSRILTVYENVHYTPWFTMNVTSQPEWFGTDPPDLKVTFDSNGITIPKEGQSVGLYVQLKSGINMSNRNYMVIRIKPDVQNLTLLIAFYYDKDGNGQWDGYDIDPTSSWAFTETGQGWVSGEWYVIYQSFSKTDYPPYPIVQIAIIALGDNNGTITIGGLTLFGAA